jgi:hypothetical protein
MAITVNDQGQVLMNGQWVTTDKSDEFKAAIDKAKAEGAAVTPNTTFAIVEKGDWLLKVGGQYGVQDPNKLAYTDNEQFDAPPGRDPDLIYAGEAVAVNGGNAAAGDAKGNSFAGNPVQAKQDPAPASEPEPQAQPVDFSNTESMVQAGVPREIAQTVVDKGAGAHLDALAKHLGITPQELASWLGKQDSAFVRDFVDNGLLPIKRDGSGNLVKTYKGEEWNSTTNTHNGDVWVYPTPDTRQPSAPAGAEALQPTDPDIWNRASVRKAQSLEGAKLYAEASGHALPTA